MWIAVTRTMVKTWTQWIISQWNVELYVLVNWVIIFSSKQPWMENLICTGHCAVCKSLIPRILQVIYWNLSLMLNRKDRIVQDWRFIQQCDQRFKPLGCDTVLVAKWLLSMIASPLKMKTQFLQTIRSHSPNGSITFKKTWFPKSYCLHYHTKPKHRQNGPTLTLFHCVNIHSSMYLLFSPPHSMLDIHKEIFWC